MRCQCPCRGRPQPTHRCDRVAVKPSITVPKLVAPVYMCKPCRSVLQRIVVTTDIDIDNDKRIVDMAFGVLDAEYDVINMNIMPLVVATSYARLGVQWATERGYAAEVHALRSGMTGKGLVNKMLSYGATLCVFVGRFDGDGTNFIADRAQELGIETHRHRIELT